MDTHNICLPCTEKDKRIQELEAVLGKCTQLLSKHWPASMSCNGLLQVAGHLAVILAQLAKHKEHEKKCMMYSFSALGCMCGLYGEKRLSEPVVKRAKKRARGRKRRIQPDLPAHSQPKPTCQTRYRRRNNE